MALAFDFDVVTFLFSAWMIHRLRLPSRPKRPEAIADGIAAGWICGDLR